MTGVLFDVDTGPQVGLGHLHRCLALAAALRQLGARCLFVARGDNQTQHRIVACGFEVETVSDREPDLAKRLSGVLAMAIRSQCHVMIVDSYQVPASYLGQLRSMGRYVVAIDDLAHESFPCHIVVNGGAHAPRLSYRSSSGDTHFLLGTPYAILSHEFWNPVHRTVRKTVRRILFTLGGADPYNLMPRLLQLANGFPEDVAISAVIGPFFQNRDEIERMLTPCQREVQVVPAPNSLRPLMLEADLAVSAGGQTLHELACVGCPTIAMSLSTNQDAHVKAYAECDVVRTVGSAEDPQIITVIAEAIRRLLNDPAARAAMSAAGQQIVDGQGARRVAQSILAGVRDLTEPAVTVAR